MYSIKKSKENAIFKPHWADKILAQAGQIKQNALQVMEKKKNHTSVL